MARGAKKEIWDMARYKIFGMVLIGMVKFVKNTLEKTVYDSFGIH